jgi:diguanylate cyclase (GGDEF)-like protein
MGTTPGDAPAGHTTVIQRLLERRGAPLTTPAPDTTATIAVMLRMLPPPKLVLAITNGGLRRQVADRLTGELVDVEVVASEEAAAQRLDGEGCHILLTDELALVRRVRKAKPERNPVILVITEADDDLERTTALGAGADDCIARRATVEELQARVALARRIAELETVLRTTLVENRKLSTTDELTGVASRRFFMKHFPREVDRAARYARSLSLVLCDIDHFKQVNDTLGHAAGDAVLRQFGARLAQDLRQGIDWVARLGGEEFAIILPETNADSAIAVARKLRAVVADSPFVVEGRRVTISASFGVCGVERVPAGHRGLTQRMARAADAALYRSKRDGRNRVTGTQLPPNDN